MVVAQEVQPRRLRVSRAEDLAAATCWYTELLGVKPYFTSETAGRGPGCVEFRMATTSTNWASSTGDSPRPDLPQALAGQSSTGTSTTWPQPWIGWSRWAPSNSRGSPSA